MHISLGQLYRLIAYVSEDLQQSHPCAIAMCIELCLHFNVYLYHMYLTKVLVLRTARANLAAGLRFAIHCQH